VRFDVEVGGEVWQVALESATSGRFKVSVNDPQTPDGRRRLLELDASQADGRISIVYLDDGRQVRAVLTRTPEGGWIVGLPHVDVPVRLGGGSAGPRVGKAGAGARRVTAPMPGRVVRVLVAAGDPVEARQPLVVIEAMKMENELRAPAAGRVAEVLVAAGQLVEAGRMLVLLE
jgi:acetyl/propionyl-CoA carboxylase alpha subunit